MVLVMSNGNRFELHHPDFLLTPPAPADHVLYYDERGIPVFLDLDSIAEADFDLRRQDQQN